MHSGFLSLRLRRTLHARTVAASVESERWRPHPDAQLLAACLDFSKLERRKIRLLKDNEREDDLALELSLGRLCIEQEGHLRSMCEANATTTAAHRARALAFASWDAGDLDYRVNVGGATEDLILQAFIRDLTREDRRL